MTDLQERFRQIKTFIFDIDGVLTNGDVHLLDTGEQYRTFDIKDSYAIERALQAGFRVGIVSVANSEGIRRWLNVLKVKDVFMGGPSDQKLNAYLGYLTRDSLNETEVLYMGDDLPDYPILSRPKVLKACPTDAVEEIKAICDYVSVKPAGRGAVREVIEHVLKAQSKWPVT
ncbi:3-deoxy-D-manno-octulosonate 8-phosphate phosphatase [Spirosoma taeanense]|uniref:3-deoxy-D-manno-octulosonate 8-phosphate phosphatase n=1 Tax=Spirosoma taeanense TaxID=2735870 RepID=A0A6M5YDA4_9BACT|nr:3-deoxy-D-manno-octulosonate 8-phosphate phosphatase [Spirosoma taeanense]QJW91969.1 3-deoxy-D-manno-octulosonate 8-phosphate phosphatase [Spirosoma taeanense]